MSFGNMMGRFPNQLQQPGLQAKTPAGFGQFSNVTGGQVPGYTTGVTQKFTPEQMQLFQNMFSMVQPNSFLGGLASGDQSQFGAMEYPALSQFNKLAGGLGSRFSGMGARRSSGFQNTLGAAASDLAQQLQSQRMGIQRQAIQDLASLSNQLLSQQPYEQFFMPQQKPFWQDLLPVLAAATGTALGGYAPLAAMLGTSLFSGLQNYQQQNPQG
jgi:hypothetical protein